MHICNYIQRILRTFSSYITVLFSKRQKLRLSHTRIFSQTCYCQIVFYRKSKFEKEVLLMIWKVNNNEIKMKRPRLPTQNSYQETQSPVKRKLNRMVSIL